MTAVNLKTILKKTNKYNMRHKLVVITWEDALACILRLQMKQVFNYSSNRTIM